MKDYLSFIVIIFIFIFSCGKNPLSYDLNEPPGDLIDPPANPVSYQYPPAIYGSAEWYQLTPDQRDSVLQIPEDVIPLISTKDLIQAYMDYPWVFLIDAFDRQQTGFERLTEDFNGLRDLLKRSDLFETAIEYYRNYDPSAFNVNWESMDIGRYMLKLNYFELLLAQESTLKRLSDHDIRVVFYECIEHYRKKEELLEYYGVHCLSSTTHIMGRLMRLLHNKYGLFEEVMKIERIDYYLDNKSAVDSKETLDMIINAGKEYIHYDLIRTE